jgi:CHAT domain-containing protein
VLEAVARADVPTVLGHRWRVGDRSARHLALEFYKVLWCAFAPAEALLEARRSITRNDRRRDDDAWAAPILLMQNA